MNIQLIADKIGFDKDTQRVLMDDLASEPALQGRSAQDLQALLFEVLGVLTGDSPRDEFPRTETDRKIYEIARRHLEPAEPDGLTRRLAWGSLWFNVRALVTSS